MLGGPTTQQQLHQPSAFGLSMTRNAPLVTRRTQLPSSTTNSTISPSVSITQSPRYRSSSSNPQSQQIQRVVPNMLQAPVDRDLLFRNVTQGTISLDYSWERDVAVWIVKRAGRFWLVVEFWMEVRGLSLGVGVCPSVPGMSLFMSGVSKLIVFNWWLCAHLGSEHAYWRTPTPFWDVCVVVAKAIHTFFIHVVGTFIFCVSCSISPLDHFWGVDTLLLLCTHWVDALAKIFHVETQSLYGIGALKTGWLACGRSKSKTDRNVLCGRMSSRRRPYSIVQIHY